MRRAAPACLLLLALLGADADGQVVQVEGQRIRTDKTGWAGEIAASVQYVRTTSEVLNIGTSVHVQFKTARHLFLVLNNVDFIRAGDTAFENRGYQHLRHNYKVKDWFTWEGFVQAQYDRPLHLRLRALVGTGPRFKVFVTPTARLYAAALVMFEREELTSDTGAHRSGRLSSYLSLTIEPSDKLRVVSTTYYQPKLGAVRDWRLASDSTLAVGITDRLSVFASLNLLHDSRPPAGVRTSAYTIKNGLAYTF